MGKISNISTSDPHSSFRTIPTLTKLVYYLSMLVSVCSYF